MWITSRTRLLLLFIFCFDVLINMFVFSNKMDIYIDISMIIAI